MTRRFLCTTALEDTWREDEPVLFLGEWCRRHSRRDRWSLLDAQVLPYHWDDRSKQYADYLYLRELHERLLQDLAGQLNRIHGVDHGVRYWRILVGFWLGSFVQMLFDRWESIREAISQYELSGTTVLDGREADAVPNDMADFTRLFLGDAWNHHLYAHILRHFSDVPCFLRQQGGDKGTSESVHAGAWSQLVNETLMGWYAKAAQTLVRERDALLLNTYLPRLDDMRMQCRLGQMPQFWRLVPAVRVAIDQGDRQWNLVGETRSEFEACARALIPRQIPSVYLEGYRRLSEQARGQAWPSRPKLIFTSNAHRTDDVFMLWAAEKSELGSPLVIGQHGGHYGTGLWCFAEDHDIEISDRYLSWGWSNPEQPKVRPVGQLKARRPHAVRRATQPRALLVTCSMPRYSYWMYSAAVARQWLDYFDDQCAFVECLPGGIQDALTVRLYPDDQGWDQVSRWSERFPNLRLDNGRSAIDELVRQSRLYISTYNATTFLESFTMNVPTVIYWNEAHWEIRESARRYFDDLKRVSIFHSTPQSAARHVTTIWDDVSRWWESAPVQDALDGFKRQFCHLPDGLLGDVECALREVAADAKAGDHHAN